MSSLEEIYRRSISDPEGFWREASAAVDWYRRPQKILDDSQSPSFRWFPDGEMNTCYNALDRHVDSGRGDQSAIVYDSPVTDTVRSVSYAELLDQVSHLAGALRSLGVEQGDRVVIYMPMIPQVVVAMLACARLGAVHSVVFGGFAPRELAIRIDDARPKIIVTASCGIETDRIIEYKPLLDRALEIAEHTVEGCVLYQRTEAAAAMRADFDHDWEELLAVAEPAACVPVRSTDPLYVLYTSGTTGRPKGVVRDNGGHAVALRWSMEAVYDVHPSEVFWAASDVGWVVGHSYIVYAPLLTGCTTVIYEGKPVGTPDPGAFWRVIAQHGVKVLFTAPTAFRAIRKEDPAGSHVGAHDLSEFRALFLAGERLDPDTYYWAQQLLDRPVVDHWWQTETGWPIVSNCLGIEALPTKAGSPTKPVPGWAVEILDPYGVELPPATEGDVAVRLPLPPGSLTTLWGDHDRFIESYFSRYPGYFLTGDGGSIDEDGYVSIMGRVDDVINVAGHRLSTGSIEAVIAAHPDVAECAVIGIADDLKGQIPVGLVVLRAESAMEPSQMETELIEQVRAEVGPVAAFRRVELVERLPKTRSGKILRRTMRSIANGEAFQPPSTIDDPGVLDEIADALAARRPEGGAI